MCVCVYVCVCMCVCVCVPARVLCIAPPYTYITPSPQKPKQNTVPTAAHPAGAAAGGGSGRPKPFTGTCVCLSLCVYLCLYGWVIVHIPNTDTYTLHPSNHTNKLQAEMPSGRWRVRHGQNRIYGCTQWHMWHWTMAYEFATNPEVILLYIYLKKKKM